MSILCSRSPVLPMPRATLIRLLNGSVIDLAVRYAMTTPSDSANMGLRRETIMVAVAAGFYHVPPPATTLAVFPSATPRASLRFLSPEEATLSREGIYQPAAHAAPRFAALR